MNIHSHNQSGTSGSSSLWIELDLVRLQSNLETIKKKTGDGVSVMAVVKANAYGHGLKPVAPALADRVDFFGVATVEEAADLRDLGIEKPVLIFGHLVPEQITAALRLQAHLSVSDLAYGMLVHETACRLGVKAPVHIKIDTGMGRYGISEDDAVESTVKLSSLRGLKLEGIYTHFPQADIAEDIFTLRQIESFQSVIKVLATHGIQFHWVHASGSSGIVNYPQANFNLIRPGLSLYGIYTAHSLREKIALDPVLSLRCRLALVKRIDAGQSVGYSRTFIADRPMTIGILPVGYSHGYPWALGNRAGVLHRGTYRPLVGRVSMDSIAIDLGSEDSRVGDIVTLIGSDRHFRISAEDLAVLAGTIPYEIVTRLRATIERIPQVAGVRPMEAAGAV